MSDVYGDPRRGVTYEPVVPLWVHLFIDPVDKRFSAMDSPTDVGMKESVGIQWRAKAELM